MRIGDPSNPTSRALIIARLEVHAGGNPTAAIRVPKDVSVYLLDNEQDSICVWGTIYLAICLEMTMFIFNTLAVLVPSTAKVKDVGILCTYAYDFVTSHPLKELSELAW